MAHYAFLDDDNIVTLVITGVTENTDDINWETEYGNRIGQTCKRTSYNTYANEGKTFTLNTSTWIWDEDE